jgi:sugar lactone lactonase YvrE
MQKNGAAGVRRCPYTSVAAIGSPGEGVLRQPEALAIAASGRVYVADQFSHLVQMFSANGTFEGQWGAAGTGKGQFGAVGGLALDAQGNIYLVDCGGDRIEKFTADGRFITAWGSRGSHVGQFDFGAGDGPADPPGGGIAVGAGYVYVSDTGNDRIERFALDGSGAKVIVGAGSRPGQVRRPQGLAVGLASAGASSGGRANTGRATAADLYVADNGNDRVQELSLQGRFVAQASTFAATPDAFQNPYDVTVSGDSVYVVDDNHGRIVRFTRELGFVGAFGGEGDYELTKFIRAVATDRAGRVYVADASADDVEVFTATGAGLHRWGRSGIQPGQFVAPVDVAAGPDGELLVAEAYREIVPLRRVGSSLNYRADIVYDSPWSSGGGVTLGAHFFSPTGLGFAADGSVWVSDRNNDLLRHLDTAGRLIGAAGDSGAAGATAGIRVEPANLVAPHGIAVDTAGDVVVADTGSNDVDELTADGRPLAAWSEVVRHAGTDAGSTSAGSGFRGPLAVAAAPNGDIYVADTGNDRVVAVSDRGRLEAVFGGPGTALGRFEDPDGIAVGREGNVFVADGALARVQEFDASGHLLAAWGTEGTALGDFDEPTGLAIDCLGDLTVADTANNRVQVFTAVAAPCGR